MLKWRCSLIEDVLGANTPAYSEPSLQPDLQSFAHSWVNRDYPVSLLISHNPDRGSYGCVQYLKHTDNGYNPVRG